MQYLLTLRPGLFLLELSYTFTLIWYEDIFILNYNDKIVAVSKSLPTKKAHARWIQHRTLPYIQGTINNTPQIVL